MHPGRGACRGAPVGVMRAQLAHIQPPEQLVAAVEGQEAARAMTRRQATARCPRPPAPPSGVSERRRACPTASAQPAASQRQRRRRPPALHVAPAATHATLRCASLTLRCAARQSLPRRGGSRGARAGAVGSALHVVDLQRLPPPALPQHLLHMRIHRHLRKPPACQQALSRPECRCDGAVRCMPWRGAAQLRP